MTGRNLLRGLVTAVLALSCALAQAGRSCEARPPSAQTVARAMQLAEHTAEWLDRSGAKVVVLARAGQDLSDHGLRYSHLGFAYRDGSAWRVAHKLNECGGARGALFRQGLGEFFLDDLFRYEAAVVVPSAELQARLRPVLADNVRLAELDEPSYSMVAYAWGTRYQQSNQWAIETLAMAQDDAVKSREQAQAWLRLSGYGPSELHISALRRLGARMTAANIAFDDHPFAQRFTDRISTVTVDSVFAWLNRTGLGGPVQVIQ